MTASKDRSFAAFDGALERILTRDLQQLVTSIFEREVGGHERLRDKRGERLQYFVDRKILIGAHRRRGLQCKAASKHGEPIEKRARRR